MTDTATVHTEDLVPVRSRISWGAIAAGSVLALALYFLFILFGGAIGLSVGDRVTGDNLATGAAIYTILVTVLCLFIGGFIASQMTVGENRSEAAIYGLLVWAGTFAMLMWLLASGVKAGLNTMVGVAAAGTVATDGTTAADWEGAARKAGVPQARIDAFKQDANAAPANAKQAAENPANQQAAAEAAKRATWYSFVGVALSMAAAVAGGYFGAGPTIRLFAVPANTRSATGRVGAAFGA